METIDDKRRRQKTVQHSRLLIAVPMDAKGLPVLHKKNEPKAVLYCGHVYIQEV
jgi:hypothetical protein